MAAPADPAQAWLATAHNVRLLDAATRATSLLAAAGVRAALIKGAALLGDRFELDERRVADIDVLLLRRDAVRARAALEAAGWRWQPPPAGPSAVFAWPSQTLRDPLGVEIDLHVAVGALPRYRLDVEGVIARAVAHPAAGPHALRACDADLVLLLCLDHGKDDGKRKPQRCEDLARLCASSAIDWPGLGQRASATGVATVLWYNLEHLREARPDLSTTLAAARRAAPRPAWWRRRLADGLLDEAAAPPLSAPARIAFGLVATDSLPRYGAALLLYAGRRALDPLLARLPTRPQRSDS